MFIGKPLKWLTVTFPYGAEYPQSIKDKGLNIHMGTDFRTDGKKEVLAPFNGKVNWTGWDDNGGNMIRMISEESENNVFLEVRYAHLEKIFTMKGDKFKTGELLGYSGNTGAATTGHHLHVDLKRVRFGNYTREVLDHDNGLFGCIDIGPYLKPSVGYCEWLPVDERYGRKYNYWAEFKIRFKTPWIHRQLMKVGRDPLSLTQREMVALVYGGWAWEGVMSPAMYPLWATLKKSEYKVRKKPPIRLSL